MAQKDIRYMQIGGKKRATSRYSMILHRTKNSHLPRNSCCIGINVLVSRDDFVYWFMANDFPGCSVDRIDNKGHYELCNMQLITIAENTSKGRSKHINGFCECRTCNEIKPTNEFAKNKKCPTGRTGVCKKCDSSREKTQSKESRERGLHRMKIYFQLVTKPKRALERSGQ